MYIKPLRPTGKRHKRCPHPNCPHNKRPYEDEIDPWKEAQCTLRKPLWMVIPPEGVHLDCPVHPEGHHVYGPRVIWMESPQYRENNLPDPARGNAI
jgi:hypothetical protein